jgi:parallel beta-helix repeat protein
VQAAVTDTAGPTAIHICPGTCTASITIGRALTLVGSGQGTGAGDTILHGAGSSVVTINPGVGAVTLQGLRITGGSTDNGAGVWHQGTSLTMTGCTIADNHATGNIALGGGLQAGGNATLINCTVSDNSADAATTPLENAQGGGILNANGTLTLNNTSVTGNSTNGSGGGIFNEDIVLLQNGSSVTGNTPDNCFGPNTVPGCSG